MLSTPPLRPRSTSIKTKRHALMGTACALGLIIAPLAGSAVVVAVTTPRPIPATLTQVAAGPPPVAVTVPVTVPATPVPALDVPRLAAHDSRQARPGR